MRQPINEGNKKVLIFSAFSDTAESLYDQVRKYMKGKYGLDTAVITGAIDGRTTVKGLKATLNNVLTCFSPISKSRDVLMPGSTTEIDILLATDCISEGQNLQDCDYLVNYDIHWNPVRIIQRFGRIDRIGSRNQFIQLVNFWPDMTLDDYINLKSRVETRMKISIMTSTGEDDVDGRGAGNRGGEIIDKVTADLVDGFHRVAAAVEGDDFVSDERNGNQKDGDKGDSKGKFDERKAGFSRFPFVHNTILA